MRVYESWCATNGLHATPGGSEAEQQLVRFLHSNRTVHEWSRGTCTNYALAVAQAFQRSGYPDPRGIQVRQWLQAVKRQRANAPVSPRTDALTRAQITAAAAPSPPEEVNGARLVRLRGLIATAVALGVDPTRGPCLQAMPRSAFEIRADDIVVAGPDGRRHLLDRQRQPEMADALEHALLGPGGTERPLMGPGSRSLTTSRVRDSEALRQAWDRSSRPTGVATARSSAAWQASFAASSEVDRLWWLKCVNPAYRALVQDRAYLLIGVAMGSRHATMKRLSVGQPVVTDTGYRIVLAPQQHKGGRMSVRQGGRPKERIKTIEHRVSDPGACTADCPVCALREHLALRQHRGALPTDPLWISQQGTALGRHAAGTRLRALITPVPAPDGRPQVIGTRSLRVTAATLARLDGLSYAQIAEEVTDTAKVATAEIYVHLPDPLAEDLTLTLMA